MTAANPERGEVVLRLACGEEVVLRPSFEALVAAEAEAGSLQTLLERAAAGDVRLADMAALFWACHRDRTRDRCDFEAAIAAAGLAETVPAYRRLLMQVFAGA
jgi:hypothetical protein